MNRDNLILFIVIFILGLLAHYAWGDNNIIEEISEDLIKLNSGIDVEFSGVNKWVLWEIENDAN